MGDISLFLIIFEAFLNAAKWLKRLLSITTNSRDAPISTMSHENGYQDER